MKVAWVGVLALAGCNMEDDPGPDAGQEGTPAPAVDGPAPPTVPDGDDLDGGIRDAGGEDDDDDRDGGFDSDPDGGGGGPGPGDDYP